MTRVTLNQMRERQRERLGLATRDTKQALYKTTRWTNASKAYRQAHPLCVLCEAEGYTRPSTVTDHKTPHGGDEAMFWNEANWQALCQRHHNAKSSYERHHPA